MFDQLAAVCAIEGVFLAREALAFGYDDNALARSLRAGIIHRVRHGAYVFADAWAELDAVGRHKLAARAVLRTAGTRMVLSHITAAAVHGTPLWDLPLDTVHVTRLDRCAGRHEAGVAQHRGLVPQDQRMEIDALPVTSPARTVMDLSTITDVEHCLPVVDDLLHRGVTSEAELAEAFTAFSPCPGSLTTAVVLRLADGRSESVGETRGRFRFRRSGLPAPVPQFEVFDEHGHVVARLDFAWPEYGVWCEFDGRVKYGHLLRPGEDTVDAVLREKRREDMIRELTGWVCIRVTWWDLEHPEQLIERLRRVLLRASA